MSTERELHKYTVEFTLTVEVNAEDAIDALERLPNRLQARSRLLPGGKNRGDG